MRQPQSSMAYIGGTIEMSIATIGDPPMDIAWYKDGYLVTDNAYINGSSTPVLKIQGLQSHDAGRYSAFIKNANSILKSQYAILALYENPQLFLYSYSQNTGMIALSFDTSIGNEYTLESTPYIESNNMQWTAIYKVMGTGAPVIIDLMINQDSLRFFRLSVK
jgi:hypothetical protein